MQSISQVKKGNSEQQDTSFSFRSLGQLQFNFETKECDFVLWISSIKQKLSVPEEYKQLFIKNLILQFFKVHLKTRIDTQFFNVRPQPLYSSPEVLPIENNFMLYGVDYLSTSMINYMFYPIQLKVRWINDSTCMLFTGFEQADDLFYHLMDPSDYDLYGENEDFPYRGWFQLQSYFIFGNERKLYLRYATTNDLEVHPKESINRYGQYEKIVKIMPWFFLEKFQALQIYNRKLTHKRIKKEKMRRMQEQALRQQQMNWSQYEEGFNQDQFYNIEEEYRFNDLNSSLADLEISIVGQNDEDDEASFYSIIGESFMFNDQDLQEISFNEASLEPLQ